MRFKLFYILLFLPLVVQITSCSKSKSIDIPLPQYKSELVVECYLKPGEPYRMLLTESVSYFDEPSIPHVDDAIVTITVQGKTDTLKYITLLPEEKDTMKYYNFASRRIVPAVYNEPFELNIVDKKGRRLSGTTTILPPPIIDTTQYFFEPKDSIGYVVTKIPIDPTQENFYRYLLLDETAVGTTLLQDIYFDEILSSTSPYLLKVDNKILVKSKNRILKYSSAKRVQYFKLFHIEESYYRYLKSVSESKDANGNPFAQPPSIHSNIVGGLGIFTGLSSVVYQLKAPQKMQ